MTLPGFTAETSLYKTSLHYRLMGALVRAGGVTFQQVHIQQMFPFPRPIHFPPFPLVRCGSCYFDVNGQCSQDCFEILGLGGWTQPCRCQSVFGCPVGSCSYSA